MVSERRAFFDEEGYWIERGLWTRDSAEELRDYYTDVHRRKKIAGWDDGLPESDILHKYPRLVHPHRVDDVSRERLLDQKIFAILEELFGEEPLAAQSMMYFKPPGARGQGLHQDQMPLHVTPGQCIACWIALDRADGDNGGLLVVPRSHHLGVLCDAGYVPDPEEFYDGGGLKIPQGLKLLQTDLEPGDALFFGGLVIHGSYANKTDDRFRRCFIGHYVGRSTESLAGFYHPLLTAEGEEVGVGAAPGGGPCGQRREMAAAAG